MLFILWIQAVLSYDYNSLVIQWKPSQCILHKCIQGYLSNDFNIHGLWPDNWNGTYPSNCATNDTFFITNTTQGVLMECWLSYNPNVTDFWYHEWSKHGTCVTPYLICDDFFDTTAHLFFAINALLRLNSIGVVPSNTTVYKVAQAQSAFSRNITFSCANTTDSRTLVNEVTFCFDKSFNWIDCRVAQKGCGSGFLMPSE